MKRNLSTLVLASVVAASGAVAGFSPSLARAGGEACTTKKFEFKKVEEACKKGGRKEAKDLMKSIVKKAKADGKDINCKSCHEDTKEFALKDNAVKDLKALM